MRVEKLTREALRKAGVTSYARDRVKNIEDQIAHAADDVGSIRGRESAQTLIDGAARTISRAEEIDRKMRRPDLYPEARSENRFPKEYGNGAAKTGMGRAAYSSKYKGLVR